MRLADMSYEYNYPPNPSYNPQFPSQTPLYNPAPIYAPNQTPFNPHNPSYSTQQQFLQQKQEQPYVQQNEQFLQQQQREQLLLQQQQQQQQMQQNAIGMPTNDNLQNQSYEFDYQPNTNYPQSHPPDMFMGQIASNLPGGSLAATALQFGPSLAATGKEFLDQKMGTFQQSKSVYKSYWDVDTSYVLRKLLYLLFPINSITTESNSFSSFPTTGDTSRSLNSPDLYIPSMSLVTYILMVGYVLGTQGRFAPDLLGITASSALVWLTIELCCSLLATYLTGNYTSGLWHKLSVLSGYKFFYMVCCIGVFVVFGSFGFYVSFLATSISSIVFSLQNLRAIFGDQNLSNNNWYLILVLSVIQPLMVYWLTWHLVHYTQVS